MEILSNNDLRLKYPGFYNIYPIRNEVSVYSLQHKIDLANFNDQLMLDDYYGRIFYSDYYQNLMPYGNEKYMEYYPCNIMYEVVDNLRVPYRKIPIFRINSLNQINPIIDYFERISPNYEILLRGQTKIYLIPRDDEEKIKLFGDKSIKEPSFLPSHLRNNFNEIFLHCMWNDQASILLNDIGSKYFKENKDFYNEYVKDVNNLRNCLHFPLFSLGIAQHYGMPSIGLDLTKEINVAAWFASHKINIDKNGLMTISIIDDFHDSTIFVFRCPRNAIFSYEATRPIHFPVGRPDRQNAWFGHVGWGYAKNQLGSYLVCGFRLNENILDEMPHKYEYFLFPNIDEDYILEHFINFKNKANYIGEAKRALQNIYMLN